MALHIQSTGYINHVWIYLSLIYKIRIFHTTASFTHIFTHISIMSTFTHAMLSSNLPHSVITLTRSPRPSTKSSPTSASPRSNARSVICRTSACRRTTRAHPKTRKTRARRRKSIRAWKPPWRKTTRYISRRMISPSRPAVSMMPCAAPSKKS